MITETRVYLKTYVRNCKVFVKVQLITECNFVVKHQQVEMITIQL